MRIAAGSSPVTHRLWQQLAIATNWPVLLAVSVLSALGIISIWADGGSNAPEGPKQLLFLAVAIALLAALQAVNYLVIGRYAWALYILGIVMIAYTLAGCTLARAHVHLPGVTPKNQAYCWISFGSISFEPSELMKVSFVMVMARYLRFRNNFRTLRGLLPPFALALLPMMMILKQPSLGVAALFVPTLLAMLFVAGAKIKHLLTIIGMGVALAPVFWLSGQDNVPILRHFPPLLHTYQRGYVRALLSSDPKVRNDSGYQQQEALIAAGSGGLSGKGMGVIPVGRGVPEARNDMIFAIIGEQFGFVGSMVVLAAYIVLFAAGLEIASATREPFGKLMAVGIVSFLAAQTFLNLMVVMRLFPVTGVTLPFISSGGSSLIASFVAAGLLLNIGQHRPLVIAKDSFEFDHASA